MKVDECDHRSVLFAPTGFQTVFYEVRLLKENIEYAILTENHPFDRERIDELLELMTDTVCTNRKMLRIAGDDYPAEVVKSRLLKLNSMHIEYVLDCMKKNTTDI